MKIRLEPQASFERTSLHSQWISVFRGLAAVAVFLGHLRNQFYPDYKSVAHPTLPFKMLVVLTGYGPQAVVLFLIMSGWLVGGSLYNRRFDPGILRRYFVDRATRLWVVLIPVMLFTLAAGLYLRGDLIPVSQLGPLTFLGNLAGLENFLVDDYGNNLVLWSLGYETWYYIAFPLLLLPFYGRVTWWVAGPLLLCMPLFLPIKLILYMFIWLTGFLFSRVRISVPGAGRALAFVLWFAVTMVVRWYRLDTNFGPDFLVGLLFAVFLSCSRVPGRLRIGAFERLSDMSYSLYAVHIPALFLMVGVTGYTGRLLDPGSRGDWLVFLSFLVAVFGFAYTFYMVFETQTSRIRRWLK